MTTDNAAQGAVDIVERRFLLTKRGLYYRPDNCGYTGIKDHAGRYREVDALGLDGVTAVHEDHAPDFSPACFPDYALAHREAEITRLRAQVADLEADLAGAREFIEKVATDRFGDRAWSHARATLAKLSAPAGEPGSDGERGRG